MTGRPFWLRVTPRLAAGGVLGLILGSGFGVVAGFEKIKLQTPAAKEALAAALKAGKTPREASTCCIFIYICNILLFFNYSFLFRFQNKISQK